MQSFSFHRWRLLVSKHWAENQKRYMLSAVAIFALLIFFFTFNLLVEKQDPISRSAQIIGYFLGLFGIGCLFAGQFFSSLGSKAKGTYYMLTPASSLEKLLCALFYVLVVFFAVYTTVYYLADLIMISIANAVSPGYNTPGVDGVIEKAWPINVFYEYNWGLSDENLLYYLLLAFVGLQSVFLLGSVFFGQYSVVKTGITLFIMFLLFAFFEGYLLHLFLPEGEHLRGFTSYVTYTNDRPDKMIEIPSWIDLVGAYILLYGVAPLFWIITYFRLTEKEI